MNGFNLLDGFRYLDIANKGVVLMEMMEHILNENGISVPVE